MCVAAGGNAMKGGILEGKVAAITGSTSGIGLSIAQDFAKAGATVIVNGTRPEKVQAALQTLPEGCWGEAFSVADSKAVASFFSKVGGKHGKLDILVNNAGIGKTVPTVKMSDDEWHEMLSIHLDGTFFCTREALKLMIPKKSGKIINMASICGLTGCASAPHYSAAKGGMLGFTRAVAREVIGYGIHVNAIAPGYIDTPLLEGLDKASLDYVVSQIPQGRLGTPQEISTLALWLAGDGGDFMVGQAVSPNGGQVIF